jgi:anaerobic selenocysteine-containing dehydrogenase
VALEKLFEGPKPAPLGQARQLGDALLELLTLLGHPARARFPEPDCGAYVRRLAAERSPGLFTQGVRMGAPAAAAAPSRRVQVAALLANAQVSKPEEGSFTLLALRHAELCPSYANTRWGREIRFENPLLMGASAAQKLGLHKGDTVLVQGPAGELKAHVLPLQGLHPEAVALAEGFGHWAGGVAATAQAKAPGEIPWWSHHGPGASVASLGTAEGGQIRVRVRKA